MHIKKITVNISKYKKYFVVTVHGRPAVNGRPNLLGTWTGHNVQRNIESKSGVRWNIVQRKLCANSTVHRFKLSGNVSDVTLFVCLIFYP